MNKIIVSAVATAVTGFVSSGAQAGPTSGPTSVTVVNTTAAPVPTSVQNTVGVDVLSVPATRARSWTGYCTINVGEYSCTSNYTQYAPAGTVMRVVGVTGVINGGCQAQNGGYASLSGSFTYNGHGAAKRIIVAGPMLPRPNNTLTVLDYSGDHFFTTISAMQLALAGAPAACPATTEFTVNYVIEPLA